MRKKLLLGNWKMNKTISEAKKFAKASVSISALAEANDVEIGVAPTFLCLEAVKKNNPNLIVSAQNLHFEDHGAYTGEISIPMLKEIGIEWAIIGHSERRQYNGETSLTCNKKILAMLAQKMVPVYCVGETEKQYEDGDTKTVIFDQIRIGLAGIDPAQASKVVVAYEPIWSIGTGKNASKEIAEEICSYIRELLVDMFGEVGNEMRILYGGSVKPENIRSYMSANNIDGALVGGASLKVESFQTLLENMLN